MMHCQSHMSLRKGADYIVSSFAHAVMRLVTNADMPRMVSRLLLSGDHTKEWHVVRSNRDCDFHAMM